MGEAPRDVGPAEGARGGKRLALLAVGYGALGLAIAGAVLPLLPTTPFLLVALWAFARSSPALAERLRRHPRLGPTIRDWEERRAIAPKAKRRAAIVMALGWAYTAWMVENPWALGAATACIGGAAIFVLTRPSA